jgi:hypothetical protein
MLTTIRIQYVRGRGKLGIAMSNFADGSDDEVDILPTDRETLAHEPRAT